MKLIELKKLIDASVLKYGENLEVVTSFHDIHLDVRHENVTINDFKCDSKRNIFVIF
jgi:hypothetical protein